MTIVDYFIDYSEIQDKNLSQVQSILQNHKKKIIGEVTIKELFSISKVYPNGIYLFYTPDFSNDLLYVGKASSRSLIDRLPAHFDPRKEAWLNALPKKVAAFDKNKSFTKCVSDALSFNVLIIGAPRTFCIDIELIFRSFLRPRYNSRDNPAQKYKGIERLGDILNACGKNDKSKENKAKEVIDVKDVVTGDVKDTVVVPARFGLDEYLDLGAYICQFRRSFKKDLKYFAFYVDGSIQRYIAQILDGPEDLIFKKGLGGNVGEIIDKALTKGRRPINNSFRVFVLSKSDDKRTIILPKEIPNNLKDRRGRKIFVRGQRYVSLDKLMTARNTSDLL